MVRRCGHRVEEVWSWGGGGVVIGWRRCGHGVEKVWPWDGGGVVME